MPASLIPLLCPTTLCPYAKDSADETVLVRLGRNGFEETEYCEELFEAVEEFRNGLARGGE